MSVGPGFTATCTALLLGGQEVRFRATGRSMAPAILDGDAVTVSPAEPGAIRPGEVILYQGARGLLAHRVIARLADGSLRLRGDAIGSEVEVVAPDRILGRVAAVNGRPPSPLARRALGGRFFRVAARLLAGLRARVSDVTGPGRDPRQGCDPRIE